MSQLIAQMTRLPIRPYVHYWQEEPLQLFESGS